jgi:hypothetical protein
LAEAYARINDVILSMHMAWLGIWFCRQSKTITSDMIFGCLCRFIWYSPRELESEEIGRRNAAEYDIILQRSYRENILDTFRMELGLAQPDDQCD